jgi:hypothetical protein
MTASVVVTGEQLPQDWIADNLTLREPLSTMSIEGGGSVLIWWLD